MADSFVLQCHIYGDSVGGLRSAPIPNLSSLRLQFICHYLSQLGFSSLGDQTGRPSHLLGLPYIFSLLRRLWGHVLTFENADFPFIFVGPFSALAFWLSHYLHVLLDYSCLLLLCYFENVEYAFNPVDWFQLFNFFNLESLR